jgi:hypothetical protein
VQFHDETDPDVRRRQLAKRLVLHRARTQTIHRFTGYSRDQLFTLRQRWGVSDEGRQRGPSPTSYSVFFKSPRARCEGSAAATLWSIFGPAAAPICERPTAIEIGERLCTLHEAFRALIPDASFDLEQLILLIDGLSSGKDIAFGQCSKCDAGKLIDISALPNLLCISCDARDVVTSRAQDCRSSRKPAKHPVNQWNDEGTANRDAEHQPTREIGCSTGGRKQDDY